MSQKFYKTTDFLTLDKQWKKKLKKSGFEDAEQDENNLKAWSSQFARPHSLKSYKFKEAYYYMATQFLNDYMFETNLDKAIWEFHTEGISIRNISKLLSKTKIKLNRNKVWAKVKYMETIMYKLYDVIA